ncbi:hypothetical protein KR200_007002, partial [Drosophila serrata]
DSVTYKLTNFRCQSYENSFVTINQCRLKAISRNKTILNFNASLANPANSIFLEYQMLKRANGYKPWLFNVKVDGCRFLRKPYDPITVLIYNVYRRFSNVNHTCPFTGDILVLGMYLTTQIKTIPYPTGDYMLSMNWIFNHKPQFITNVSFQFVEDL